ncbi:MAG: hypothetical protein WC859_07880 [Elusimicrobiota bacterium]|jgi:hypothetical protein
MSKHATRAGVVWVLLIAGFWLIYGLTPRHNYSYDGLCYACDVELAPVSNLFHPNHLLYTAVSSEAWHLFRWFGYPGRALFFMQNLNAFVGALAVALLGWLVSRRYGAVLGLVAGGCWGASYALWSEVTDPGCYAWAALAAVLLLGLLLESDQADAFWVGAGHGVLVLFHQMLILLAPAFAVQLVMRRARPWRALLAYSMGLLLTVGLPYGLIATVFHGSSWREAIYWALGPGGPPPGVAILSRFWWSLDWVPNVVNAWKGLVGSLLWYEFSKTSFAVGSIVLAIGIGAWTGWVVRKRRWARRKELWSLLIWVIVLNVFLFFFYTGTIRYRILLWPVLLYLAAMALAETHRPFVYGTLGFLGVLGMLVFNGWRGLRPLRQVPPGLAYVEWVAREVRETDFLLFAGTGDSSVQNVYMAYFAPRVPARSVQGYFFSHPGGDITFLDRRVRLSVLQGGRFWVESSLLDPAFQRVLETGALRPVPPGTLARWFRAYRVEEERTGPAGYRLARLRPLKKVFQAR